MILESSIADIVHQYVELFFRSEILQVFCRAACIHTYTYMGARMYVYMLIRMYV